MDMDVYADMNWETLLTVYGVIWLVAMALSLTWWIFQSVGLYSIAKRRGIPHGWTAWIFSFWTVGAISDQYQGYANGKKTSRRKILLGLYLGQLAVVVLMFVVMGMMVAGGIQESEGLLAGGMVGFFLVYFAEWGLLIAITVFQYVALYDVYRSCNPGNATLFLVLSILLGISPFLVFADRKKDFGMISWQQKQWQQQQQWQAWQQQQQWQAQQAWQQQQQWQAPQGPNQP